MTDNTAIALVICGVALLCLAICEVPSDYQVAHKCVAPAVGKSDG